MIARNMKSILENPANGVIRKMFEEGALLKKKYGEDNVYDFSIGNPDLDPPSEVVEAIEEIAADTSPMCHGYMPNPGYMQARQAMAEKTSLEQGTAVPADCVIMSVGAAGAMNCVFKALLNVGDEVIVPAPYFAEYGHYCANHGGTLRPVPTKNDFSLDTDAIKAALTEKTGRYPYIVCDEPYRAITYGGKKVAPVFPEYRQAVVVTSFAKNLSVPGERIGYIAVNPASDDASEMVAACILATRILGFVNAPAFFQKVIARSWNARCDYSLYEKRCREIMEIMDYAGLQYAKPEGAFYLFVKVPEGWNGDDMAFTEHLKKFNILCAPGTGFGGKGWFRISYCVAEKTILNSKEAFYKAIHSK